MYNTIGNFGGTLMLDGIPICEFKFLNGQITRDRIKILNSDIKMWPAGLDPNSSPKAWRIFFEEQTTPPDRYHILEDLHDTPIREYNIEQLLRYAEARSASNPHWVKCDNDLSCWAPWQIEELKQLGKI